MNNGLPTGSFKLSRGTKQGYPLSPYLFMLVLEIILVLEILLRTTVPLVSYIRNSLRFWYYASLSTCCQNFEKKWGHRENLGESGGQAFKGSDREKCQFWYFGNFQYQAFASFW